jgi:hypothetical protein
MPSRPHEDPSCRCEPCRVWDLAHEIADCADTLRDVTRVPCGHGYAWQCPYEMALRKAVAD